MSMPGGAPSPASLISAHRRLDLSRSLVLLRDFLPDLPSAVRRLYLRHRVSLLAEFFPMPVAPRRRLHPRRRSLRLPAAVTIGQGRQSIHTHISLNSRHVRQVRRHCIRGEKNVLFIGGENVFATKTDESSGDAC